MPLGARIVGRFIPRSPFIPALPPSSPITARPAGDTTPMPLAPPDAVSPHLAPFRMVSALWRKPMVLMFAGTAAIYGTFVSLRANGQLDLHGWGILLDSGMLLLEGVIVAQLEREQREEATAQALQVRTNALLEQQITLLTAQNALLAQQGALLAAQVPRHRSIDDAEQPITQ